MDKNERRMMTDLNRELAACRTEIRQLQADVERLRDRAALLNSLLGEALRQGCLNETACSPTWLTEARKSVTP